MKIECSGPNGETFEAQFEVIDCAASGLYDVGYKRADEVNKANLEAAQKALETWCNAFKVEQPIT